MLELDLSKLSILKANSININELPDEFFEKLKSLEHLEMKSNDLSILPRNVVKLSNLKILDLSRNEIQLCPDVLWLINLRELNLSANRSDSYYTFPKIPDHSI